MAERSERKEEPSRIEANMERYRCPYAPGHESRNTDRQCKQRKTGILDGAEMDCGEQSRHDQQTGDTGESCGEPALKKASIHDFFDNRCPDHDHHDQDDRRESTCSIDQVASVVLNACFGERVGPARSQRRIQQRHRNQLDARSHREEQRIAELSGNLIIGQEVARADPTREDRQHRDQGAPRRERRYAEQWNGDVGGIASEPGRAEHEQRCELRDYPADCPVPNCQESSNGLLCSHDRSGCSFASSQDLRRPLRDPLRSGFTVTIGRLIG
jgi:hypothetical protein